jgi:hypothetical protein
LFLFLEGVAVVGSLVLDGSGLVVFGASVRKAYLSLSMPNLRTGVS